MDSSRRHGKRPRSVGSGVQGEPGVALKAKV
jgi:hypothetical protein